MCGRFRGCGVVDVLAVVLHKLHGDFNRFMHARPKASLLEIETSTKNFC